MFYTLSALSHVLAKTPLKPVTATFYSDVSMLKRDGSTKLWHALKKPPKLEDSLQVIACTISGFFTS
jgi:hypothetical protein